MKSSIKYGLVLFSVLMAVSFGVALAEKQMASNNTSKVMPLNNTTKVVGNNTTKAVGNDSKLTVKSVTNNTSKAMPLNNTTKTVPMNNSSKPSKYKRITTLAGAECPGITILVEISRRVFANGQEVSQLYNTSLTI